MTVGMPAESALWRIAKSAAFAKILVGVVIVLAWQLAADAFAANFVARPTGIIEAIPAVLEHPRFFPAIKNTLGALCIGIVIALVTGTTVGVLMGRIKVVDRLLMFYVIGFYAMPDGGDHSDPDDLVRVDRRGDANGDHSVRWVLFHRPQHE